MNTYQNNQWRGARVAAVLVLASAITATTASAATDKSGVIGGETWTPAMSPIRVVGDITVANLTIQPGVEVIFTGNFKFDCPGVLTATGNATNKIWFHGDTGITWKGIDFFPGSSLSVMDYCIAQDSAANGISITDCFPAISNCEIMNNSGSYGGGMDIRLKDPGILVVSGCTISNNAANSDGGGVHINASANIVVRLTDCNFVDNLAQQTNNGLVGGGAYFQGAGKCELLRCSFLGNQASVNDNSSSSFTAFGGGIYSSIGTLSLRNCELRSNVAKATGNSGGSGGGLHIGSGNASLYNCCIRENSESGARGDAAGMVLSAGTARVENCTIVNNNPRLGIYRLGGTLTVINSIIYFNNAGASQVAGTATITYSNVQNGYAGEGNINADPILLPEGTQPCPQYHCRMSVYSLCKDAGSPVADYNDLYFNDCWGSYGTARNDMGAYGGPGAALWDGRDPRPEIISITGSGTHRFGDTITLTASVAGIPPFSYQWSRNGVAVADDPPRVTGAKTATLVILNAGADDAGMYTVFVESLLGYGSDTSPPPTTPVELSPLWIDLRMFAGVIIQAQPGTTVKVEYSNDLVSWTTLTQFVLPSSPYTYYDTDSPNHPKRFYRATEIE